MTPAPLIQRGWVKWLLHLSDSEWLGLNDSFTSDSEGSGQMTPAHLWFRGVGLIDSCTSLIQRGRVKGGRHISVEGIHLYNWLDIPLSRSLTCVTRAADTSVLWGSRRLTCGDAGGPIHTAVWVDQAGVPSILTELPYPSRSTETLWGRDEPVIIDLQTNTITNLVL
jgi:hypothetical protein